MVRDVQRNIEGAIQKALADTPVVLLNGARQTGKTTRVQAITEKTAAQDFTLDDAATLALAAGDPSGFIRNLNGLVVLDEIHVEADDRGLFLKKKKRGASHGIAGQSPDRLPAGYPDAEGLFWDPQKNIVTGKRNR